MPLPRIPTPRGQHPEA
ncbi:DUF3982 domain-containing protein [Cohnella sp. GbtcB17]